MTSRPPDDDLDVRYVDVRQGGLLARADLGPFLQDAPGYEFEWVILLGNVEIPDDPRLLAVAEGQIAFHRRGRGLQMGGRSDNDDALLPKRRVRHTFHAALRETDEAAVVLDSLKLGPPAGFTEGVDEPDGGVTWAALRAVKPDLIVAAVLVWIRAEPTMLARLVELDKGQWHLTRQRQQDYEALVARIDATRAKPRRRHRVGVGMTSDELYRDVALLCIHEFEAGRRRGFHELVTDAYGVPRKTAADWIYKARANRWLAPVPAGRIAFAPGARFQSEEENDGKTT